MANNADAIDLMNEITRLQDALAALSGAAMDVLQGFEAHRQIQSGKGGGMGGNILTEVAGKYGSLSCWLRVARAVETANALLSSRSA